MLLKVGVDVCCPTVCDMQVCNYGGTDAQGVGREVHVRSSKSDVGKACRFLRRGMSSPKTVMNALTAEMALVLAEPEPEVILIRHIQV